MMQIISRKKIWFTISIILVCLSVASLLVWGLNLGIDFKGGSLIRLKFNQISLNKEQIKEAIYDPQKQEDKELMEEKITSLSIQPISENQKIIKLNSIDEVTHQKVLELIRKKAAELNNNQGQGGELVEEIKFDSIGPSIGKELREKSKNAVIFVLIAIILYVAWAFKKVSSDLSKYESFRYGIVAIIALIHDILITLGLFSVLGNFKGVEIDIFFIAALLTILGYSVNDTIIVFDRIRENVLKEGSQDFPNLVNKSVNEILVRSINTSVTTLLVLFCILILGGYSTFYFVLALIIGIISGTYSSIFLASPLLVFWKQKRT
ncbi:MAG: protein translocase subunit SecF [Candidatus Moranbacteria bacterium]|nr:protein translocase subunit SecF [Candidatus Moranbacteria bacterium]